MSNTFDAVCRALSEIIGLEPGDVTPESNLASDLSADSLDLYDVVNILELEFSIRVEDRELYDLESVGDLVSLVDRLRAPG